MRGRIGERERKVKGRMWKGWEGGRWMERIGKEEKNRDVGETNGETRKRTR